MNRNIVCDNLYILRTHLPNVTALRLEVAKASLRPSGVNITLEITGCVVDTDQ
jgi:hypothetical protein